MEFLDSLRPLASPGSFLTYAKPLRTIRCSALLVLLGASLVAGPVHARQQQDSSKGNMAGMDMSGDMKDMGPSMAAMAGHMYITPLRPKQPGDEEKVRALVAQIQASIERYRDYRKALEDGYVIGNPNVNRAAVSLHQGGQRPGGRAPLRSDQAIVAALFPDADAALQAGGCDVHCSADCERR